MCVWRGKGQAGAGGKPLRSRSPPSPHGSLPSEGGGMTPWIGVGGGKEGRAGPCGRRRGSRHVGRGGGWEGGRERSAGRAQGRWQHQQQQQPGRRRRRLAAAVSARCCEAGPRRAPTTGLRRACQRLGGGPESAVVLTRFLPPLSSVLSSPPQKNPLFLPPFRPPIADILLRSPPPNPPIPTPPGCAAPAGSASAAHIARACSTER